jgi:uncharacterized SAM-dependent methyltransferase
MRKTKYILDAIVESKKNIVYCAVDLAQDSLTKSLSPLVKEYPSIKFIGLWGTYHDSLDWTRKNLSKHVQKLFLWLGSSIGNLTRKDAAEFLKTFQEQGMNEGDMFVCGIDKRNAFEKVSLAYNDRSGLSRAFSLNGIDHMNHLFKSKVFNVNQFEFVSIYNEIEGRHEAYYESLVHQTISHQNPDFQVTLKKGELINFEYSYKYSRQEVDELIQFAHLTEAGFWSDEKKLYNVHMFFKSPIHFETSEPLELLAKSIPLSMIPTLSEWKSLWKASDTITTGIIDSSRYLSKPIDLRHPYIFYLGHLPAFMDIQVCKATGESLMEPAYFAEMFERGMDPCMEDPSQCHTHSKVPDEWPTVQEIFHYRQLVRQRVMQYIQSNHLSKRLSRVMNMCYEHEAMHMETLLYMFLQDVPNTNLSTILPMPIFSKADKTIPMASWISMSGGSVEMGMDTSESHDFNDGEALLPFGWDNEAPRHSKPVSSFEIQHRPITIGEYNEFLKVKEWDVELIPASWIKEENEWKVRTIYGPISFDSTWSWPVSTSHFQATTYAGHYGLSLPTEEQIVFARSIYPSTHRDNQSFLSFHPQNVVVSSERVEGLVGDGWEMTSSEFTPFPNFEGSELYPGYSLDFL